MKQYTNMPFSPPEAYINDFTTNVVGTSNVIQALVPLLRKRDTRRIINISSILGSIENTTEGYGSSVSRINLLFHVLLIIIFIVSCLQSCCQHVDSCCSWST